MRTLPTRGGADQDTEGVRIPPDAGYERPKLVAAIRAARATRKVSVQDMAAHLGIGRTVLAELERGDTDPTWPILQRIRDRLHWTDFAGTEEVVPVTYSRFTDLQNRAARADAQSRRAEQALARVKELEMRLDDLDVENDQLRGALREAVEALQEAT